MGSLTSPRFNARTLGQASCDADWLLLSLVEYQVQALGKCTALFDADSVNLRRYGSSKLRTKPARFVLRQRFWLPRTKNFLHNITEGSNLRHDVFPYGQGDFFAGFRIAATA